jgi:hypothetical protein
MARPELILRIVARLVPAEFRERVLEPTVDDLRREEAEKPTTTSRQWLARVNIAAECLRLGVPQFIWRRRRLTKLGVTVVATALLIVLVLQSLRYSYAARP